MSYIPNYFTTTLRVLTRNNFSSCINIVGLSVGFSGCLLIALFVFDELKFDRHFPNADRIVRVTADFGKNGLHYSSAQTPGLLAQELYEGLPEIQSATRLIVPDEAFLFLKEKAFKEAIIFTDSSFLQVFGIRLLRGNPLTCLREQGSIMVSESMAEKLYGRDWKRHEILGETLLLDGHVPMIVTAVFSDLSPHTHFHSSIFATVPRDQDNWLENDVYTYAMLRENANVQNAQEKLLSATLHFTNVKYEEARYHLQKLTDIHLRSRYEEDLTSGGNIANIYALGLIAVFLVVTSVINFVSLYTAQTLGRYKEVGVRKVLGALRRQLSQQFMVETGFVVLIGFGFSMIISFAVLPAFNTLAGKQLTWNNFFELPMILLMLGLGTLVVLLAGTYPAVYLSSRKPIETLKGKLKSGSHSFKHGLLIFQFTISGIMIILTWIALKQMSFVEHQPLGFDKDQILLLHHPYMIGNLEKIKTFRDVLEQVPGVEKVSISGYTPAQTRWKKIQVTFPVADQKNSVAANWMLADEDFLETMGITLLEGRNFSENHSRESNTVIINEQAVALLQLRAEGKHPVGQQLFYENSDGSIEKYEVIGVVKDFNFSSLHDDVKPVVLRAGYHRFEMALRLGKETFAEAIAGIEAHWKKFAPQIPFEYDFMQERFTGLHRKDAVVGELFSIFGGHTIFIALSGLFSMVRQTTIGRTKEIGIRKVLGASEKSIVLLLSANFLKRVLASGLMAAPIAWLLAKVWLNNFAFKTEMSWWIFIATIFLMLFMAFVTLSYESIRAAVTNPVLNLRHE